MNFASSDMYEVVRNVWDCVLGLPIEPAPHDTRWHDDKRLLGAISISGEWTGVVILQASRDAALDAARCMLKDESGHLSEDDVRDVLAELTNIVGGSIKSLVPGPSSLALPCVVTGDSYDLRLTNASLVCDSLLFSDGNPVRVEIWGGGRTGKAKA